MPPLKKKEKRGMAVRDAISASGVFGSSGDVLRTSVSQTNFFSREEGDVTAAEKRTELLFFFFFFPEGSLVCLFGIYIPAVLC